MDRLQLLILILIQVSIASSIANSETESESAPSPDDSLDFPGSEHCKKLPTTRRSIHVQLGDKSNGKLVVQGLYSCGWNEPKLNDVQFSKTGESSFDATAQVGRFSVQGFPVFLEGHGKIASGTIKKEGNVGKVKVSVKSDKDKVSVEAKSADFGFGFPTTSHCPSCDKFSQQDMDIFLGAFGEYAKANVRAQVTSFIKDRMDVLFAARCDLTVAN